MLTIDELQKELQNWGTVTDCAKQCGISKQRVSQLLSLGRLGNTVGIGGVRLIRKPYHISYVGSGPKGGRPRKHTKIIKERKEGETIQ